MRPSIGLVTWLPSCRRHFVLLIRANFGETDLNRGKKNSEATRIASEARGWSWSRAASAARACLTWAGSAGKVPV